MRILVDARALGIKPSGIGMYIYRFVEAFARQTDFEIHLASDVMESDEMKSLSDYPSITVHLFGKHIDKSFSVWKYTAYLKKLIDDIKPQVFWEMNNLLPVRIKNPFGKYILTIHDVFPLSMPGYYGRIYPYYFKRGLRLSLDCCDGAVFVSDTARKETAAFFESINKLKTLVGYIIVPPIPVVDIPRSDFFLYVGNIENRKGSDILLKSYERYVRMGGKRDLYLAGSVRDSDIRSMLEEISEKTEKIHYLGYISIEERNKLYQSCGCFLFPSRAEGFGIPVVEALSCGSPVIASDLGIFKELVGDKIEYFNLSGDFDASCNSFLNSLIRFDGSGWCASDLRETADRFTEERLLPPMVEFIRESAE